MQTSKTYHRRTKKGSIIKVVRERYLRDDIHCGKESCEICVKVDEKYLPKKCCVYLQDESRVNLSKLCPQSHYVLPDLDVLLYQFDVLEDDAFGNNVIILKTVLNEVRDRNISVYAKLKEIENHRHFYVLVNEFHRDLFFERETDEKPNDYIDRLIRISIEWYRKHFQSPKVVLLTSTEQKKKQAKDAGLLCFTFAEYVESLKSSNAIIDKVAQIENAEINSQEAKFLYDEHLSLNVIQAGIKTGKYYQSKLMMNRFNNFEGYVHLILNNEDVRVLIKGRSNLNRAVHDDIVAVELLPESEWSVESDIIVDEEEVENEEVDEIVQVEKKVDVHAAKDEVSKKPTAKVVAIIKRNWRQYCGVLKLKSDKLMKSMIMTSHLFIPAEKRIPFIKIETRQYDVLKGQRIIVAIDSWPRDSKYPKGHYVRALGEIGDKDTENELLLIENDIPHLKFTTAVLNCLPSNPDTWRIPEEEYSKRLDLRDRCICSVDPPGCTDIDDALHCKEIGNGLFEVGVHIADVSYFVKPNTALDKEAASRGTTVYLVDNRIDMIPTVLSSNLCSLIEKKERLTFSVIWIMDAKTAEIKETKFAKSIIKSRAALTYAEAQLRIDSPNLNDDLTVNLRRLNSIAAKLKQKRLQNGALVLANFGELRFVEVESETHDNVMEIESKKLRDTNSMVEEFMLLANISVAEKIYNHFPEFAVLRRHPKPSASNLDELVKAAKAKGFEVSVSNGKELSESLDKAVDPQNAFYNLMLRMITVRCMRKAEYFCTGTLPKNEESLYHFGLAAPIYTHFTSPIRRYADLLVHRQLSHAIEASTIDPSLLSKDKLKKVCDNINTRHNNAQNANRASVELHTLLYIKKSGKALREDGYILYIFKNGIQIFIPRLAYCANYLFQNIKEWDFDDVNSTVFHSKTNCLLKRFDPVTVSLEIVDKSNEYNRGKEKIEVKIINPCIDFESDEQEIKRIKK